MIPYSFATHHGDLVAFARPINILSFLTHFSARAH
jgi:hypothetical protein